MQSDTEKLRGPGSWLTARRSLTGVVAGILVSRYTLWFVLALPAFEYVAEFLWPTRYYPEIMSRTGYLSMQLLVLTLAVTPISLILRLHNQTAPIALWFNRSRRYFGLAAAGYAALHTLFYLRSIAFDFHLAWLEGIEVEFATGWIAMILMVPLAMTSNNWSVRKMGPRWKLLQRFSYPIAILVFIHWLLLDFFFVEILVWIGVLLTAKTFQIAFNNQFFLPSRSKS